jgi:hypothetical protein
MNYFPFYHDTVASARALDDKRITRVFAESVMVLSKLQFRLTGELGPYSPRTTMPRVLFDWLVEHEPGRLWFIQWVRDLLDECGWRFGVSHVLQYSSTRKWAVLLPEFREATVPVDVNFLNMARAAVKGLDYSHRVNVHAAYRDYVAYQWVHIDKRPCVWTDRAAPDFFPRDSLPPELRHFIEGVTA